MAWTTPGTATAGEVLTAAFWNTNVRDNTNDLRSYQNRYGSFRRTAGNIALTATTSWSDLTTIGSGGDITLNASTGDVIEATIFALLNNAAVEMSLDIVTIVSSSAVNSLGVGGTAPTLFSAYNSSGWYAIGSTIVPISGSLSYTLAAGDISSGTVTLRVRYAMSAATSRTLYASTANPFFWYARNHGPVTT